MTVIPKYQVPEKENVPIKVMPKSKSKRQVGYLLGGGSPLTDEQKSKLKKELHSGAVKVKKNKARDPRDVKFY